MNFDCKILIQIIFKLELKKKHDFGRKLVKNYNKLLNILAKIVGEKQDATVLESKKKIEDKIQIIKERECCFIWFINCISHLNINFEIK